MKKSYMISVVGASVLGAGAVSYFLMNDGQKARIKSTFDKFINKQQDGEDNTLEKAGNPEQLEIRDYADIENAKMVSEGSQYGIHYYNEVQEESPYF